MWICIALLSGCDVSIPNGLFACGQEADCPSGYFCWSSDSRCYDSKEPQCEPKSCEQVISQFGSLGIAIECGSLPDGCDGSIDCGGCPEGSVCGANGQNFICGCEENSCSNFEEGAECGFVPMRCGGDSQPIYCGDCLNELEACQDNRCVCPAGVNCYQGCPGGCGANEVCVDGECCEPAYPCSDNECSPPGGFPDGCGGVTHCPECMNGEDCVLTGDLEFKCLGDCTCEAQGVECGSAIVCGSPALCGTCQNNGFEPGFHCDNGRCVCEDQYEYNDSLDDVPLICGEALGVNCMQEAWTVDVQATLHGSKDIDYYALRVLDARTPIMAQAFGGLSGRILHMTYLCPDGYEGIEDCTGSSDSIDGIQFCVGEGDLVGLQRKCDESSSSDVGTVLVGVQSREFQGDCDGYGLKVHATYTSELPSL